MIYPDTSFLFSRYVTDAHSVEVNRRMGLHPAVILTPFHRAELADAIFQWVFRGKTSVLEAELAFADFEADCAAGVWLWIGVPEKAYQGCAELAQRNGPTLAVRTLDTLHVAAAIELKATRFWTFDERQTKLAEVEGLATA